MYHKTDRHKTKFFQKEEDNGSFTRYITGSGSANMTPSSSNTGGLQDREFAPAIGADDQNGPSGPTTTPSKPGKSPVNRSQGNGRKHNVPNVPQVTSTPVMSGTPGLPASTEPQTSMNFWRRLYWGAALCYVQNATGHRRQQWQRAGGPV